MERHAYINLEPNNGGIVLNVSDGGLCFHSFDPVPRNGKVRFWFSDNGQRIEADGTLAWADETQKGGLRFAALPAEAREKIREWMSQPSVPLAADDESVPAGPRPRTFPTLSITPTDTKAAPAGPGSLAVVSSELRVPMPLSGFSRGLATGLLVSAVVMAAVLFHSYRREFGESLIQLGERFAAKPEAQTLTVSAASPVVAPPAPQIASPAPAPLPVAQPEKVLAQPQKLAPQPLAKPAEPQQAKLELATPIPAAPAAVGEAVPKAVPKAAAPASSLAAPAISLPTSASATAPTTEPSTASAAGSSPLKPGTAPKLELVNQPGVHTEGSGAENPDSTRELYFEVGRFKNVLQAHDETDKLALLGFPATAVEKGHLWANSFHVLVGPYGDEDQAKATHENLVSSGFKPRPFEKGWRNFTLLSALTLNGARTPEGDYTISWESYIGDASVKFMHNNSVVATAGGRWVKRDVKYPRDAYVYKRNADGSRTLLEIHFGGMRQALVFGKAS
jgi:hypothetical protein